MRGTSSLHAPSAISAVASAATAQASGLAIKVGPCIRALGRIPSATLDVASVAASDIKPPVKAFPTHIMSGVIPAESAAKSSPVRPNPVAISSAMRLLRGLAALVSFSQRTSAAKPRSNLISDEQYIVPIAYFAYAYQELMVMKPHAPS